MLAFTEAFAEWRFFDVSFACTSCQTISPARVWGRASIDQRENVYGPTEALIVEKAWRDAYVSLAAVRCPHCGARNPDGVALQNKRFSDSRNVVVWITGLTMFAPLMFFLGAQPLIGLASTVVLIALAVILNWGLARRIPSLEEIDRRVVFHVPPAPA